ncbi:MAG: ABC transporter transmembrane domain-containing protein [Campylobacterota bacterium]|nr:ABC transporter transmembrane domain-containing protein [Campylobacterota bacterium]
MLKLIIKRLFVYVKPYIKYLIISSISMVMVGGLTALVAYLIKPVLDDIFISKNKQMLVLLPIAVVIVYLLKGIFTYLQSWYAAYVGENVLFKIRNDLFECMSMLSLDFFDRYHTGELISRIMNDTGMLQEVVARTIPDATRESFTVVFLLIVIYMNNVKLALISTIVFPIAIYPLINLGNRLRKIGKKRQETVAMVTTILQEAFTGIRVIKAFATEKKESKKFEQKGNDFLKINLKSVRVSELVSPLMEFIGAIGLAFLIWFGGYLVFKGTITVGAFFSFVAALFMLYKPFKSIARAYGKVQAVLPAAERIFGMMDRKPTVINKKNAIEFAELKKGINFKNVSFSYEDREVLKDINLFIPAGEIVAFVGESGGGKSTLMDLIPRFYDINTGCICFDDTNVKDFNLSSLRRHIGIVSQHTFLFNDTVKNNISYGMDGKVNMEDIIKVSTAAFAHDFIQKLPHGYDTVLGEQGFTLSGGERQRIAIARALLKNPQILILDEATASLDSSSEEIVQKALNTLIKGRTTLVVAHRFSTILNVPMIVVIKDGRIIDCGNHQELFDRCDYYHKLYKMQFKI